MAGWELKPWGHEKRLAEKNKKFGFKICHRFIPCTEITMNKEQALHCLLMSSLFHTPSDANWIFIRLIICITTVMLLLWQPLSDHQTASLKIKPTNQGCGCSVSQRWLTSLMMRSEIYRWYKRTEDSLECKMIVYRWTDHGNHLDTALSWHLKTMFLMSIMDPKSRPTWMLDSVDKGGRRDG